MVYRAIGQLVRYGVGKGLIRSADAVYTYNRLLEILALPGDCKENIESAEAKHTLHELLALLTDDACRRGVIKDTQGSRELFDTRLMGALTPLPSAVADRFAQEYQDSPARATDWFYDFSRDVNYIRADRIRKDIRWRSETEYGALDITVNMSKPEKDPRDIAAAGSAPTRGYPRCLLCSETEGYAGRADFPARQNHRIVPLPLCGEAWGFQYSPYVYYHQHCIILNTRHVPMVIEPRTFDLLFGFLRQFPHFFVGSNADLPIVGGSILSHEHFQGGNYEFPMAKAPVEHPFALDQFPDVSAGIVRWPLSVIRLSGAESEALTAAASHILDIWRGYSDKSADILASTNGEPHNTVTPIARIRDGQYELDIVLRNNRTSGEHPLGIFHPHEEYHHIKKENIGLIEVMGMAILPSRLRGELREIKKAMRENQPSPDPPHADWVKAMTKRYAAANRPMQTMSEAKLETALRAEVGKVFCGVLEDCGVFKRNEAGRRAFGKFIAAISA
ncbi:MAG: UDP-glucose--hexose-1-phosphate uridylyltransferase [Clostridiales bacterium]|nr:UDP-glucose--hexose-1-phosphate uridylyltransferase [Clostridiales bacterium]